MQRFHRFGQPVTPHVQNVTSTNPLNFPVKGCRRGRARILCPKIWLAVRQGFEPWRLLLAYTLSRRAPSTTRPPHRAQQRGANNRRSARSQDCDCRSWQTIPYEPLKGRPFHVVLEKARRDLRESLLAIAPIFSEKPFFMNEEFTLVDCCVAPILWRLPLLGIELPPKQAKPICAL